MDPFAPLKPAPVPGHPGLFVRTIPASEAEEALTLFARDEDGKVDHVGALIGMVVLCACDESGARRFTADDREKLTAAPLAVIRACAEAAMDHNGLESVEGNSQPGP